MNFDHVDTMTEILGDEREPETVTLFTPETLPDTPELPPPGIYFGMPEDLYHLLPALSSHGVRKLAGSPMNFWASTSWLSAKRRKAEQERALDERIHQVIGKAYHCRIMEGAEEYARRFAVDPAAEDCAGALESTDEIKAAIAKFGIKPWSKVPDELADGTEFLRPARKADWIRQLLAQDPDAKILDVMREQHREANKGKLFISAEAFEQIEIAAAMVERDPQVCHAFKGGFAEVVLIWNCARTGVPMKARVDYLKLKSVVDLKSIANQRERSIEQAIRFEIAGYHYNVQPSVYAEGVDAVRKLVREGDCIHDLYPESDMLRTASLVSWARKWAKETDLEWLFVFQQKGDAPVTRGCFYPLGGTTKMLTDDIVLRAKRQFRQCSEVFGVDPWLDIKPIYDLADEDLPASATEI